MKLWLALALAATCAACNTISGLGRDIAIVGGAMADASDEALRTGGGAAPEDCQQSGSGKGNTQACAPGN